MGVMRRARQISDDDFLEAMKEVRLLRPDQFGVSRFDVASVLGGLSEQIEQNARDPLSDYVFEVPGVDERRVLDRARKLIKHKVISGCDCGCPGYFTFAGERPEVTRWLSETGS